MRWKADVSYTHPFLLATENRAVSSRANTNKENIPSSSDSSSGSVREETGCSVDAQGGQSALSEQTPKPRKTKHSPTLVQLTANQDAHTVSNNVSSPLVFLFFDLSSTLLLHCGFLIAVVFLSLPQVSLRCRQPRQCRRFSQLFIVTYRLLQIVVSSEIAAVFM